MRLKTINRFRGMRGCRTVGCVLLAAGALQLIAAVEKPSSTTIKDFSVPAYYDPPHEKQMKSLLQGAEAEPQPGGMIWITEVKLQTFSEAGQPQVQVQAPHCIFDPVQHTVSSSGPLTVKSVNGQFYLEGEGFLWQQTNSNLIISNRVRTVIHNASNLSLKP
jgi:hypothetical protein